MSKPFYTLRKKMSPTAQKAAAEKKYDLNVFLKCKNKDDLATIIIPREAPENLKA